jgi:hypothetical protein
MMVIMLVMIESKRLLVAVTKQSNITWMLSYICWRA